jgi:hypothetical protein
VTTTPAHLHARAIGTRPPRSPGTSAPRRTRVIARWLTSFLGFPIGGYAAFLALGPMDSTASALAGGAVAGAGLGLAQAWAFGPSRPSPVAWVLATAAGLAAGAAVGATMTDYATDVASLVVFGAVTGAMVGVAQGVVLVRHLGAAALLWPLLLTGAWALGWRVSEAVIGSSVDQHFYIFGASGALVVAALTSPVAPLLSRPTVVRSTHARIAAVSLALASLLAIAGFTVLGIVFQYPQILEEPTGDVLELFRANQTAVTSWFLVLVVSAALMAPAGIALGRLVGGPLGRWIAVVGMGAATVQVVGLQRWVTLVPGIAKDALNPAARGDAEERFELWHLVLGKIVGETIGYALTAIFTVLVVHALRGTVLPRWAAIIGYTAAALIATGIAVPLVPAASLTNFAGYVAWCAWLLLVSWLLLRRTAPQQAPVTDDHNRRTSA